MGTGLGGGNSEGGGQGLDVDARLEELERDSRRFRESLERIERLLDGVLSSEDDQELGSVGRPSRALYVIDPDTNKVARASYDSATGGWKFTEE
jgi:hypothetical protein